MGYSREVVLAASLMASLAIGVAVGLLDPRVTVALAAIAIAASH
jgi:hypothetical protein